MKFCNVNFLLVLLSGLASEFFFVCFAEESHSDEWEWAGVFNIKSIDRSYVWSAEKSGGEYAATSMQILWLQVASADEDGVEDFEDIANNAFEVQKPLIATISNASILANGTLYEMRFDQDAWITLFDITFPSSGYWAAFTEHEPTEFESSSHYFRDFEGGDVEAEYEVSSHDHGEDESSSSSDGHESGSSSLSKSRRVGLTVAACVTVWVCTFAGLLVLAAVKALTVDQHGNFLLLAKMFAAGALLSTAFALILPESMHLIEARGGDIEESEVAGYWCAMVLVGFITPVILDIVNELTLQRLYTRLPQDDDHGDSKGRMLSESKSTDIVRPAATAAAENEDKPVVPTGAMDASDTSSTATASVPVMDAAHFERRSRVVSGVLIGDFMHNFCDGVFIGAAFKSCSVSFGWTVASTTVFHELTQELADFIALTSIAGFPALTALAFNFCSGISVLVGGLVIAFSSVSDFQVGMLLSFGAGQYLYVATVELLPDIFHDHQHASDSKDEISCNSEPVRNVEEGTDVATTAVVNTTAGAAEGGQLADEANHGAINEPIDDTVKMMIKKGTMVKVSPKMKILGLLCFTLAAVAVGLVLLDHGHCDEDNGHSSSGDDSADADGGHAH